MGQHLTRHQQKAYGQNIEGSNGPGPLLAYCAVPRPAPCSRLEWSAGATIFPLDSAQVVDVTRGIMHMYIWPETGADAASLHTVSATLSWVHTMSSLARPDYCALTSNQIELYRGCAVHQFLMHVPDIHPRLQSVMCPNLWGLHHLDHVCVYVAIVNNEHVYVSQ